MRIMWNDIKYRMKLLLQIGNDIDFICKLQYFNSAFNMYIQVNLISLQEIDFRNKWGKGKERALTTFCMPVKPLSMRTHTSMHTHTNSANVVYMFLYHLFSGAMYQLLVKMLLFHGSHAVLEDVNLCLVRCSCSSEKF